MKRTGLLALGTVCALASLMCIAATFSEEPGANDQVAASGNSAEGGPQAGEEADLSLAVARDRAKVMYDLYAATLDVLHHRYFHGERAVVPARAMQDVFSAIKRQSQVEARWISVNMRPMSIDHEPTSDFEKRAAKAIAAGQGSLEVVEAGYYRRAGAILLGDGCVGCHGGLATQPSKTPKFAGLVISIPIRRVSTAESE